MRGPELILVDPADGGIRPSGPVEITARFSESLSADSIDNDAFRLRSIATGGPLLADRIDLRGNGRTVALTFNRLAAGDYQLVIDGSAVKDRSGNPMAVAESTSQFRVVDATIFWSSPLGGDWHDPNNWSAGRVPNDTDNVVIGQRGAIIVTARQNVTVAQLHTEERLQFNILTLDLNGPSTLAGGITAVGLTLNADAPTRLSGNSIVRDGSRFTGAGPVEHDGTLTMAGFFSTGLSTTLNNRGTIIAEFNPWSFNNGTLNNLPDGVYELRGDVAIVISGGTNALNNQGLIRIRSPIFVTFVVPLNNIGGTVDVQSGNVIFLSPGANRDASYIVAEGAKLNFDHANITIAGASRASGQGMLTINRPVTVETGAEFVFDLTGNSLVINGDLIVLGTAINAGNATWTFGTIRGTLTNTGTLVMMTGTLDGKLINQGTLIHRGPMRAANAAEFINQAGATYEFRDSPSMGGTSGGAQEVINNEGTMLKTGPGTATIFAEVLLRHTSPVLDVQQGILSPRGGLALRDASVRVARDAALSIIFQAAASSASGSTLLSGDGSFNLSNVLNIEAGGQLIFDLPAGRLNLLQASQVIGDGTVVNRGRGLMAGNARMAAAGGMTNSGDIEIANNPRLDTMFENQGTVTHTASAFLTLNNATIINRGRYDIVGGRLNAISGSVNAFDNLGDFVNGAPTFVLIDVPFSSSGNVIAQAGELRFLRGYTQSAGLLNLAGGHVGGNNTFDLLGGMLAGSGTITGNVINRATIDVGGTNRSGTITVTGNYEQTASGVLTIELGGTDTAQFDRLLLNTVGTRTTTLDGTLTILTIDGFLPAVGNSFTILSFDSLAGDFATTTGLDVGAGVTLAKQRTATSITLVATAAP